MIQSAHIRPYTCIRLHPIQIALRVQIILEAEKGSGNKEISRTLNISVDMVRYWRKRFLALAQRDVPVVDRLMDADRTGTPDKLYTRAIDPSVCYCL